jgi:prolyl 4-hydroxylase
VTDSTVPRQTVTPALRKWVTAQAAAGFSISAMSQAMLEAGWDPLLVEQVLSGPATLPPPLAVPWPSDKDMGSGSGLSAGDRSVKVLMAMQKPPLLLLESFLSEGECRALIAAAKPRMARSLTVAVDTGGEEENRDRTSEGMFFKRCENALIRRIETRIAALLNWPLENGEGLQVLRYGPGTEYKPHYDYFDPTEAGTPSVLSRGGQRVATLIMYLNEPEAGGATVFPEAHVEVLPVRGNAVFFNYCRPHPVSATLHGGAVVTAGEKWIATKWLREREFV